jgi:hypothetical protein
MQIGELKEETSVLRNDIAMLQEIIQTTGERERALAERIKVVEEEL